MNNYFNLLKPDYTCILVSNTEIIYKSKENSVKPFVKYIYYNGLPDGETILVDKIIGLAIANVAIHCKLKKVYAKILSKPAYNLLIKHNVEIRYEQLVENILRRDRADICPMEKKIMESTSPKDAYDMLKEIVINKNNIHLQ